MVKVSSFNQLLQLHLRNNNLSLKIYITSQSLTAMELVNQSPIKPERAPA